MQSNQVAVVSTSTIDRILQISDLSLSLSPAFSLTLSFSWMSISHKRIPVKRTVILFSYLSQMGRLRFFFLQNAKKMVIDVLASIWTNFKWFCVLLCHLFYTASIFRRVQFIIKIPLNFFLFMIHNQSCTWKRQTVSRFIDLWFWMLKCEVLSSYEKKHNFFLFYICYKFVCISMWTVAFKRLSMRYMKCGYVGDFTFLDVFKIFSSLQKHFSMYPNSKSVQNRECKPKKNPLHKAKRTFASFYDCWIVVCYNTLTHLSGANCVRGVTRTSDIVLVNGFKSSDKYRKMMPKKPHLYTIVAIATFTFLSFDCTDEIPP